MTRRRSGFALFLVLWAIVLTAIVLGSLQSAAFTQSVAGREAVARTRAYWAARAGVEATLARLENIAITDTSGDGFVAMDEMSRAAQGAFEESSYLVSHTTPRGEELGPADAHARLNINLLSPEQLLAIDPIMLEDVVAGTLDWIDDDDETLPLGAEVGVYQSLPHPYEPRNGPMRTIRELEMVVGTYPLEVRGEDWNQNGLLDPNEDDGTASFPPDNADGRLDAGWSGVLTADSIDGGLTVSGEEPLDLREATAADVDKRLGVDGDQADTIIEYVQKADNPQMADFIRRSLRQLKQTIQEPGAPQARVASLTTDQLAKLLDECYLGEEEVSTTLGGPTPGRLNVNTCEVETLAMIPEVGDALAEAIVAEREARPKGFTSMADLLEVEGMSRAALSRVFHLLTVRSNVFVVRSRGKDERTGLEVEIVATIDRSSIPVVVRGVRTQ